MLIYITKDFQMYNKRLVEFLLTHCVNSVSVPQKFNILTV